MDENREEAEEFHGLHMADMAAYPALKEFALLHRTVPTAAEKLMWDLLRGNSTGFQFRRQHVLGKYIADFVSLPARLVIEIDGLIHQLPENQDADSIRTEWLNQMGFEILRFTNEEVLHAPQQALTTIKNHLKNQATTTIPEGPLLTKNQATAPLPERPFPPRGKAGMGAAGEGRDGGFMPATTPLPERPFPPRGKAGMGAAGEDGALHQDPDVLDTWFSSWLWPMEVFGWNADPHHADLQHFYPTTTLVTAPEIIFFWVARMAMAGYKFTGQRPFEQVYFTGIVRDKQGRKMSKSLGNSPDLLALIDQWGADAVRFSVMISSPAGNDLLYDEGTLEQGRNFCNKLWNAARLLQAWQERGLDAQAAPNDFPAQWMEARINAAAASLEQLFAQFRLSEALKQLYSLIWDDYCSWYLEWLKPAPDAHLAQQDHDTAIRLFDRLLQLLHPFLPFVTEELYHGITARSEGADLINLPMMPAAEADAATMLEGAGLQRIITAIRDARAKNNIKPREAATLYVLSAGDALYKKHENLLMRHTGAQAIQYVAEPLPGLLSIVSGTDKLFLKTAVTQQDTAAQIAALTKELEYLKGFLVSVDKKLGNEKFVQNAKPEVIAAEQKKRADAEEKIKTLTESISLL